MEDSVKEAPIPRYRSLHLVFFDLIAAAEWWEEGSRQNGVPSYCRTSARRPFLFILAAISLIAMSAGIDLIEGASDNHDNTNPPPTLASMAQEFYSFERQQALEQDLAHTYCDMDPFMENAIRALTAIEAEAKFFKQYTWFFMQRLLGLRDIKNQYTDHHARLEAAAGQSDQAITINEDLPGQTHKLKLCFNGSLQSTIYTNKPLLAQSNGGIEIAICRGDRIITSGHLASLRVEIVALDKDHSCNGDWTENDFDRQIRLSRDGQGSVLDGERLVELVNGRASLGNIRFKEGSTGTRSREFVLAARVCKSENIGGRRVEEAFMHPPFSVLVERSKGNEKSSLPKLGDKIHDLKGIARNGSYARRLQNDNIFTVQDFLKALNKGQDKLHEILEIKSLSSWKAMVRHARQCDLRDRQELKSYKVETENVSLFFNCVDDLVGAKFHGLFVAKDKFDAAQKLLVEKQLKQAYSKLDGITFDYVMESNHPVQISTNINAAGSTSIPTLLGASPQNAPGHQATFQAENLRPFVSGIDCAPGLPLGDENWNPAGQSSSELSRPFHRNGHTKQGLGQNSVANPKEYTICPNTASSSVTHADNMDRVGKSNTMPGCSSEVTFAVAGTPFFFPQACGTSNSSDYVMKSNHPVKILTDIDAAGSTPVPTLLGASPQNVPGHQATFQAIENLRPLGYGIDCVPCLPLGDANCNTAGLSASEPSRLDHLNEYVNQGLGQNHIPDPERGAILPNSDANVDSMEELWNLLEALGQTNPVPARASGGTYAELGTPIFCQQANGSEAPNDESFWPEQVADAALDMSH